MLYYEPEQIYVLTQRYGVLIRRCRLAVSHSVGLMKGNKFNFRLKFQNKFKPKFISFYQTMLKASVLLSGGSRELKVPQLPQTCQPAKQRVARAIQECTDSAAATSKPHTKSHPQIKLISFRHQKTPKEDRVQRAMLKHQSLSSRFSAGEFGPSSINYPFMPLTGISGPVVETHAIAQCSYMLTNRCSLCPKFLGQITALITT